MANGSVKDYITQWESEFVSGLGLFAKQKSLEKD